MLLLSRLSSVLALVLATLHVPASLAAETNAEASRRPHPPKRAFPVLALPDAASQGERAVSALGTRLPEVAAWYGRSGDEFRQLLRNDRRLRLDRRGRLFAVDELEAPLTPAQETVHSGALLPLDQTLKLHSRPGAQRTIYLNFTGATLSGTAWNSAGTNITALPFDLDGIPYSFSTTELQRIQYIWQRVAEDYAPFDVNVTTEAPPADALTRSSGTDQVFGTTVLVTSSVGVYSCSCGGVAYLGVFDDTSNFYKPALVFYDKLGGGNEKYVAEAISHEAGHNMGLSHDGTASVGYYQGHGSGATGWAPIMGVGYYQPLVQWSKGEYSGANNVQNDFTVMQSNGLPIRVDDHGNTPATATALTGADTGGGIVSYNARGVVERPGDVDSFGFVAAAGSVNIVLSPAARAANLDAQLQLIDPAGNLLASANPTDALGATLAVVVPAAGSYTVQVVGVGKGDPLATGYSNYGSLGHYGLAINAPSGAGLAPVAVAAGTPTSGTVPLTVAFSAAGSADPDGSIVAYTWNFGDGSPVASGASVSHVYNAAGSYTAQLTVTDNTGLTASAAVPVTVNPVVVILPMRVADIAMGLTVQANGRARASAAVRVVDGNGNPVAGATVTGRWSGLVTGNVSGVTGSTGVVNFSSATTRAAGTFTFTVTGITLAGYQYQSTLNTETSDSITR